MKNLIQTISIEKVKNFLEILLKLSSSLKVVDLNFLNEIDSSKNTILHNAVINKDLSLITDLISVSNLANNDEKRKFLDMQNKDGDTALHLAAKLCENKNAEPKCEAIAKLLDNAGSNKNIANKGGFIVSSSESAAPNASEYRDRLFKMFGGQQSQSSSPPSSSPLSSSPLSSSPQSSSSSLSGQLPNISGSNKKSNLDNITTEVSVDNIKSKPLTHLKTNLMNITSEVSIDNSLTGGSSTESSNESSNESSTESTMSDSNETKKSGESSISSNSSLITESSSLTYSGSSGLSESHHEGQRGGAKLTESSELSDTSTFVKSLLTQFNSMKGGSRNVRGQRTLPSLSDYELSEMYGGRDFGLSREQMKESSNIHDEVVKMFVDSGKTEEDARILKMALYKYTKDKNPDLNNLDRAKKMKEYASDSKIIKNLDLTATRKIYEDVKKSKSMMTESSNSTEMTESTEEKPKKTSAKKETVKKTSVKKTSAKRSNKK
jgi:hypothetical protein